MWKPLAIVSGLITLAAGGIMYTQVQNPIKGERAQEAASKTNQGKAAKRKQEAVSAKAKEETDLNDAKDELTKNQQAKMAAQLAKDAKLADLEKAKGELDTADKELAALQKKLTDFGGLEVLAGELKQLEAKKAELEARMASTKDAITATIAHKEATDKLIAAVKERDLWQKTGTMAANFSTRILSVNNELAFVELGAGDLQNVVKQAKLFVVRGGSPVGRLIVTDLKSSKSIATIIPGSVAAGDSILPGDRVVVDSTSTPTALKTTEAAADKKAGDKKSAEKKKPAPGDVADPFATPTDGSTPAPAPAPSEPAPAAPAAAEPAPAAEATPAAPAPADGAAPAMEEKK